MTKSHDKPVSTSEADTVAPDPDDRTRISEPSGRRAADQAVRDFAGYRVLEKIGEGGMGEVYRAEQIDPIRRIVALKVIKPGMDSREVIARFESERQALALMNHAGIAKVYDAGTTPEGRPYFAMEYIQGIPITEFVETQQLSLAERLQLFVRVCDAVQHAHQKAILHRDLKPSNVLVTLESEVPQPKVIDFGVAKALLQRLTEKTLYTELGRFVGTPEYMSPEQAQGSGEVLDTRSDIYSLGVILYEILVGTRPFDRRLVKGGVDELRRLIREDDPPRPSTRIATEFPDGTVTTRSTGPVPTARILRGDLDWITMKALNKDPARRYATATELARDVERHLRNDPVLASPPSSAYRLRKLVRRHRTGFLFAGVTTVAIVGGLVATTLGLVTVQRERDLTEQARAESEEVTSFLAEMLESADPAQSGGQVTVTEMLDGAAARIGSSFKDRPILEARLRETIGSTYHALGLYDRAVRELPRVLDLRRGELGIEHQGTLAAQQSLAALYIDMGRFTDAERECEQLLETRMRLLGSEHEDTLSAKYNLATVYQQQGRLDLAEQLHREVLDARSRLLGENHLATLDSFENLANIHWSRSDFAPAGELYGRVYAGRTGQLGKDHPTTLDALNNLAAIDHTAGHYELAETRYRDALETGRRVRGPEHPQTLVTQGNLGELYGDLGRFEEAEALLRETLEIKERVLGLSHPSAEYTRSVLRKIRDSARSPEEPKPR